MTKQKVMISKSSEDISSNLNCSNNNVQVEIKENDFSFSEDDPSEVEVPINLQNKYKKYACSYKNCHAEFDRPDRLKSHMGIHTGEKPYVCVYDDCIKAYTRSWHLKRHVQAVHEEKGNEKKYKCLLCEKLFKTKRTLKRHMKNIHEKRKYVCAICSKPFRKNQHLKSHEYEHTGIKPFLCHHEGCDKRFFVPSKLKRHMKIHLGYKCDVDNCDAVFNTWTLLVQHRKTSHPLSYTCDTCKKKFKSRYNLQVHLRIHQEKREQFNCPYENCQKFYLDRRNLALHIKSYHEGYKFVCPHEYCNEQFRCKVSVKRHLKLHSKEYTENLKSKERKRHRNYKKRKSRKRKQRDEAAYLSGYIPSKIDEVLDEGKNICNAYECNTTDNYEIKTKISENDKTAFKNKFEDSSPESKINECNNNDPLCNIKFIKIKL